MGNVKSQHSKFNDQRASFSSDHPSFYQRRKSSIHRQEESRKNSQERNVIPLSQQSSLIDGSYKDDEVNRNTESINGSGAHQHAFPRIYDKRPKSYPTVQPKKSAEKSGPRHIPTSINSSEDDINAKTQMHYLLKHYFNGNFNAPIQDILRQPSSFLCDDQTKMKTKSTNPVRILDICCSSGVWILEMASEYPNVQCCGVNPTKAFPTVVKPSNAHFFCCDVARNDTLLQFPAYHFDFVRMAMIYKSYNNDQWKILAEEINRVLKPGGYFELRDVDPIMKHTGPLGQAFFEHYAKIVKDKLGVDMDWYRYMCEYMEQYGGMIDIHLEEGTMPVGWGQGQIPQILLRLVRAGLQSHQQVWPDLLEEPGAYKDKTKRVLEEAIDQHAYYNFYLCWGRKPYFPEISRLHTHDYESTPMKDDCNSEICALVNGYEE